MVDYTPDDAVSAGDVIALGSLAAIAHLDIPANALGAVSISGVYEVVKGTSESVSLGAKVYWDATNSVATCTASTNLYLGRAVQAAATAAAEVVVAINLP